MDKAFSPWWRSSHRGVARPVGVDGRGFFPGNRRLALALPFMREAALVLLLAACGSGASSHSASASHGASTGRADATADAATTATSDADGPESRGSVADDAGWADVIGATSDAGWGDARAQDAGSSCTPFPCAAGQFCLDTIGTPLGGNEVQSSCSDLPDLCQAAPTCECLLQAVLCARECVAQGTAITVSCWVSVVSPP